MYSLNLLAMAMELARENPAYEDVASKFWEHFLYIAHAMGHQGKDTQLDLWDDADGFFYDNLNLPDGTRHPLKIRSMVGLIPLFAVETLEPDMIERLDGFRRRLDWFVEHRPDLTDNVACMKTPGRERAAAAVGGHRGSPDAGARAHARRARVPVAVRHPGAVARPQGRALPAAGRRPRPSRRLRAGRVVDRAVRRQLELARADLVPGQLPAGRGAAEVPPLLRRQHPRRMPDRIRDHADAGRGRHRAVAAPVADLPARRRTAGGPCSAASSASSTIRTGATTCPSTSISTATTGAASGPRTRPAGPPWSPSCCSRAAARQEGREVIAAGAAERGRMRT